jgi:hypothetical protein
MKSMLKAAAEQVEKNILKLCQSAVVELYKVHSEGFKGERGTHQFPKWSGALAASTGAAIYCNGVFDSFVPNIYYPKNVQYDSHGNEIDGRVLLESAIAAGATQYTKGIWIVLYSTVPYATKINLEGSVIIRRGIAFFDRLKHVIIDAIMNGIEPTYGSQGELDF